MKSKKFAIKCESCDVYYNSDTQNESELIANTHFVLNENHILDIINIEDIDNFIHTKYPSR